MENETVTVEDLRQGSDAVLRKVYEENRAKFLNFAKRYNLTEEENLDVYQDAYVIFYDNIMSGKIESLTSSISTYLFGIGKYLIFNQMRKNKKKVDTNFDISLGVPDELVSSFEIEKPDLTTEQQQLQQYFGTLGEKCQELLNLFYYRGYTIKEIVEIGAYNNENVVKSQKSRCLKTLRERIKGK